MKSKNENEKMIPILKSELLNLKDFLKNTETNISNESAKFRESQLILDSLIHDRNYISSAIEGRERDLKAILDEEKGLSELIHFCLTGSYPTAPPVPESVFLRILPTSTYAVDVFVKILKLKKVAHNQQVSPGSFIFRILVSNDLGETYVTCDNGITTNGIITDPFRSVVRVKLPKNVGINKVVKVEVIKENDVTCDVMFNAEVVDEDKWLSGILSKDVKFVQDFTSDDEMGGQLLFDV